jgi:hypothetical protein
LRSRAQAVMTESRDYEGVSLIFSFGYQDLQGWTAKMSLKDLLRTMVYLDTSSSGSGASNLINSTAY